MKHEIKVPAVGESITEATIGSWNKKNGDYVKKNDILLSLETDKASVEIVSEFEGVLNISADNGKTVSIGSVIGFVDSAAKANTELPPIPTTDLPPIPVAVAPSAPATSATMSASAAMTAPQAPKAQPELQSHLSPAVQRVVSENNLNPSAISGTGRGGRITKEDAMSAATSSATTGASMNMITPQPASRPQPAMTPPAIHETADQKRVPMTTIRKRIAERLVMSQQTTATLTTFNEVDMTRVMALRAKYKDKFKEKFNVNLGFMGFFVKASIEALKAFPAVNAFIDGTDIIFNNHLNIGVAVGTEKGLVVPVIRNAETMTIASIESAIRDYGIKGKEGKISIDDLNGGTFTISNGGVYGSLMSTPILNPPQSGILGMHKIQDRPMVIDGQIVVRPMMYLALSYDHRIIDGKEAVSFLVKIKEGIEEPERLLLEI